MKTKYNEVVVSLVALMVLASLVLQFVGLQKAPEVVTETVSVPEVVKETVTVEVPVLAPGNTTYFQDFQGGVPFRWAHDNQKHPVSRIMAAGMLKACQDFNLLCENMSVSEVDTPAVLAMLDQSLDLGSTGQVFPIYLPEHYPQAIKLIEAGVPVVGTHFPVDPANVPGLLAWVAPDNVGYAIATAKAMAEKTTCGSPIAITQSSLNDGENAVAENFKNTYLEVCPDAEVLPVQIEGFDVPQAIQVASAIIQAHPDLKGAFSTTGNGPQTWAGAVQDMGKEKGEITIISMDYVRQNLTLVKEGWVYMLVGQPLFEEFYYAVVLLELHKMGYPVPYENTLPAPLVTIENVDKYYAINDLAESVK